MSLTDAFLVQDPVPGEVWIALRSPEVRGSGTENDPYNGARANHPLLTVSAVDVVPSGNNYVVTITTAVDHGFTANEAVLVTGIAAPDGELLNGCFSVTPVGGQPRKFTYTVIFSLLDMYPAPGTGSSTPSGVTCQKDPFLFDAVMLQLAALAKPATVRLGPGVFETKGFTDLRTSVSWSPFERLKVRGAGMAVTTLKLVMASYRNRHYWAIGMPTLFSAADPADQFEASDFTIDCNSSGQLTTTGYLWGSGAPRQSHPPVEAPGHQLRETGSWPMGGHQCFTSRT